MHHILRLFALHIWFASLAYLITSIVKIILWSAERFSPPFDIMDLPPLTSMEFPEHPVIVISIAGIIHVAALRLSPIWMNRFFFRYLSGGLVLALGVYLMLAKGFVCLVSADTSIAQLHQITFGSVTAMTLAAVWSLTDHQGKE